MLIKYHLLFFACRRLSSSAFGSPVREWLGIKAALNRSPRLEHREDCEQTPDNCESNLQRYAREDDGSKIGVSF